MTVFCDMSIGGLLSIFSRRIEENTVTGSYTPLGWVRLAWEVGLTRLFHRDARLIRRPLYLRGARNIAFGKRITIGRGARIEAFGRTGETNILFGTDVEINDYAHIGSVRRITIGNRVLIASRVFITDHNHGAYSDRDVEMCYLRPIGGTGDISDWSAPTVPPGERPLSIAPVVIGDDVWLGEGVAVLPGVTIGAGSIVGANAVVTRDIPPASIAVGIPARVVRRYDPERGWIAVS